MPPRRRRDRLVVNAAMEGDMIQLHASLDAMETTQRREPNVGDFSESENEDVEAEEVVGEQAAKERLLRVFVKLGTIEKIEVPMYEGSLDVEELFDWISALDKYFYYEDIDDEHSDEVEGTHSVMVG
jgi:adenine-specific DNA methylase